MQYNVSILQIKNMRMDIFINLNPDIFLLNLLNTSSMKNIVKTKEWKIVDLWKTLVSV